MSEHIRVFVEKTIKSCLGTSRLVVATCSCGWHGTAASTKAAAGKGWRRHFEAITGRKAA